MSAELKKVVIIGASGDIGRVVLDAFVKSSQFDVTILSRLDSKATFPGQFTVCKSDLSKQEELIKVFEGKDVVISVVGADGFEDQKKFIDAAVSAKVKRFIPSEFSINTRSPGLRKLLPIFEKKLEVLDYLKSRESDGLTWTAIWTSMLFDKFLANGFMEFDIKAGVGKIWDAGESSFTVTTTAQLHRTILAVLNDPERTANRDIYVASFEITQNMLLTALEKATQSRWTVERTTTETELRLAKKMMDEGDQSGIYKLSRAAVFSNLPDLRANFARDEKLANEMLGLHMEDLDVSVSTIVAHGSD